MKIIGSDYDGTLTHGGINGEKLSAIKSWRKAGNKFGIVSGRGGDFRRELLQKFPRLELDFFVACNGAYITDQSGSVIYQAVCDNVSVSKFAAWLFSFGCDFVHVINGESYICIVEKMEDKPSGTADECVCLLKNLPKPDCFNQVSICFPTVEETNTVKNKIRQAYGDVLNPLQNGRYIDIVPLGTNKAQGLYRVMEHFSVAYEDVTAVGDNFNDIDMLKEFHSYAMESGVEEIRRFADGIVSDVTELLKI